MDTTNDKLVELKPSKLFDASLRALFLVYAKVRTGSSRTCSFLIEGNNTFLKTATFGRSHANISGDLLDGVVRFFGSAIIAVG